jgi:uncharacterized protein (DUF697 family)
MADQEPDGARAAALQFVKKRMWWSAAVGALPVPFVDFAAVTAVQHNMLRKLCDLYGVDYREDRAREWVGALVGGVAPTLLKTIPLFSLTVGLVSGPLFYGASTYAVGRVFMEHFETGGTLLTFDADRMREYFQKFYAEARAQVAGSPVPDRSV